MKCDICGNNYKLLANHVWQAHKIDVKDYKVKYNYPLTKALADDDWIERMKEIGEENKKSVFGKTHLSKLAEAGKQQAQARADRKINPAPARKRKYWPKQSKDKVDRIGGESKRKKVELMFEQAKTEWMNGVPIKEMCVSDVVIYRWKNDGRLPDRKKKISDDHLRKLQEGSKAARNRQNDQLPNNP